MNMSAGKNINIEGSVYHNRSAAIALSNNKRRTMVNHTPNGAININGGTYHLMNVSQNSSASKNAKEILASQPYRAGSYGERNSLNIGSTFQTPSKN